VLSVINECVIFHFPEIPIPTLNPITPTLISNQLLNILKLYLCGKALGYNGITAPRKINNTKHIFLLNC
jgi:hypothetical protein